MIRALVSGKIHGAPVARTAANGKPFATAGVWVEVGAESSVWCSAIAFGQAAERLLTLRAGDAVSASGRLTPKVFEGRDAPRVSLDLVVDEIASVRRKARTAAADAIADPDASMET